MQYEEYIFTVGWLHISESDLTSSDFTASYNLHACRFDSDTIWPDQELLPDGFDACYKDDLSSLKDDDDYDFDFSDTSRFAITEQLDSNVNSSTEIYAPAIANGATDNAYGVKTVNSMSDFVGQFPNQYQADIQLILDSSELNYTCQ